MSDQRDDKSNDEYSKVLADSFKQHAEMSIPDLCIIEIAIQRNYFFVVFAIGATPQDVVYLTPTEWLSLGFLEWSEDLINKIQQTQPRSEVNH